MGYINNNQTSKFQEFVLNKLFAQNKNVYEIPVLDRLTITLEILKQHKKAWDLITKDDNLYLNFLSISRIVLFPSDNKTTTDLIDLAFKVVLKETCLTKYDDDLHKLLEVYNKVRDTVNETNKEIKEKQKENKKWGMGV